MTPRSQYSLDDVLAVWNVLKHHRGRANAVTQPNLAYLAGFFTDDGHDIGQPNVRKLQAILHECRDKFPLPVLSGTSGVYVMACAAEANDYFRAMQSRHREMSLTMVACRKKILDAGFAQVGAWEFSDPPAIQEEMPLVLT